MLQKLSLLDMHVALKNRIEQGAGLRCVDHVKVNEPAPFTYLEFVEVVEENTKTMYVDRFTVHIHIISEPATSSIQHYENIKAVQEALTEYIQLPEGYEVFDQVASGLVSNYIEKDTNERHAVLAFVFRVSYGFKVKII